MAIVPPWQHYDEPTHFEYAWLIANTNRLPQPGDENAAMRREVLNTLFANDFFRSMPSPSLLTDEGEVWLGISSLGHPPLYYAVVSLPLRLVTQLDVVSQLYVARAVSLLMLLLTIAVIWGAMRDLVPRSHPLAWAVPLAVALLPTFADSMTSVNSDVGAALVISFLLWGCVRLIRYGLNWRIVSWVLGAAIVGVFTKNTAAVGVPVALLALSTALSLRYMHISRRWLVAVGAGLFLAAVCSLVTFGDAAAWYRWSIGEAQPDGTQVSSETAPIGGYALLLEAEPEASIRQLTNPLFPQQVQTLRGQPITVGGWVWANEPGAIAKLGVRYTAANQIGALDATMPVTATDVPQFVAMQFTPPKGVYSLAYVLQVERTDSAPSPDVFLDGAFLVSGAFPTDSMPRFQNTDATNGTWSGSSFTNLLRNGSGEQRWLRLQPWVERSAYRYIHRSPAQVFAALLDVQRIGPQIVAQVVPIAYDSLLGWFGWGTVKFTNPVWLFLSRFAGVLAVCSAVTWLIRQRHMADRRRYYALLLIASAGIIAWSNLILRPLPLLGSENVLPIARYTLPAILATSLTLVGGLWALVPRTYRLWTLILLLVGLVVLNITVLHAIRVLL